MTSVMGKRLVTATLLTATLISTTAFAAPREAPEGRAYYVAQTSRDGGAQLDLSFYEDELFGSCLLETTGERFEVSGFRDAGGVWRGEIYGAANDVVGEFTAEFAEQGMTMAGEWRFPPDAQAQQLRGELVALYVEEFVEKEGVEIYLSYPRFVVKSPSALLLRDQIAEDAREDADGFLERARSLRSGGGATTSEAWNRELRFEISYYRDDMVSIFIDAYEYVGGAHGQTFFAARNVALDGMRPRVFGLDAICEGDDYVEEITEAIADMLEEKDAEFDAPPTVEPTALDASALNAFTVGPVGLEFAFAPGVIDSRTFDPVFLLVPYDEIDGCLDESGPLAPLLR
jgi:hypothetical protein